MLPAVKWQGTLLIFMKRGNGEFEKAGTTADTTFTKTGLSSGTTYPFRVRARYAAGSLSGWSEELAVVTCG
jgi:hypothetical protein